jgi:tellurite resistance protein TerC
MGEGLLSTIAGPWAWAGFLAFVLAMLALDLGVFHRKEHVISAREAAIWSAVWIVLSLAFCGVLWWQAGSELAIEYLTGYLIEKSLSVDNLFVFVVVFAALSIPREEQHRVLFWGILSALVLRGAMIFAGTALLHRFHWLLYVFGAFLLVTGARLAWRWHRPKHEEATTEAKLLRAVKRVVPTTENLHGRHFFTVENGRRVATPLFVALVLIEITDVIFALDSIPAIFGVTEDPFIVFTSNIFAILGLRSLFFLVAAAVSRFHALQLGLSAVLVFIGGKMLVAPFFHVPPWIALLVTIGILLASVIPTAWRAWLERRERVDRTPRRTSTA